jgi:hypothetical protein
MARSIASKPNTIAVSVQDPYGNLRDKVPGTPGTKVNALLLADAMVFFDKMMAEASIAPNGFPENATNTFQYILALKKLIGHDPTIFVVGAGGSPSFEGTNLATTTSGNNLRFYKIGRRVTIEGSWRYDRSASGTDLVLTLPVGYRPEQLTQRFMLIDAYDLSYKPGGLIVTSVGSVAFENPGGGSGFAEMFVGSVSYLTA